jgi:hypothetical protein
MKEIGKKGKEINLMGMYSHFYDKYLLEMYFMEMKRKNREESINKLLKN